LPVAEQASFNAFDRQHEPYCQEGTRVNVLEEIKRWVVVDDGTCVFWLNGIAGAGKTTIARTICKEFRQSGLLGANFFFSRNHRSLSSAWVLFTTLARQLSTTSDALRDKIKDAIAAKQDIVTSSLEDQWTALIYKPLCECGDDIGKATMVVVIDALDECEGDKNIQVVISMLVRARNITNVKFRIVLTSRPETPIRNEFWKSAIHSHELILHAVPDEEVNHDICSYLGSRLSEIGRAQKEVGWPSPRVVDHLVKLSRGLFIYAATICRWIEDDPLHSPRESLEIFLNGKEDFNPAETLDQLYTQILERTARNASETMRNHLHECIIRVLGWIVVLLEPLSLRALGRLMEVPARTIRKWLDELHSVVYLPNTDEGMVRLYHPSFHDFLLVRAWRRNTLWIDICRSNHELAQSSLKLLRTPGVLRKDICQVIHPSAIRQEYEGSIPLNIPSEVAYACRNWVHHTVRGGNLPLEGGEEHQFLEDNFLYWIEALIWLGHFSQSEDLILILLEQTELDSIATPPRSSFLVDARQFLLNCGEYVDQAPLQIYGSALFFAPEHSIIRTTFRNHLSSDLNERILGTHSGCINAVCFSPDGRYVASASEDRIVKVWEIEHRREVRNLSGHMHGVNTVCFSPDGELIASGSEDNSVKIWTTQGTAVKTLKGHSNSVTALCFSSD
ncbi:hypothetical protein K461DRAFT_206629, partial [Myriangium duriaei CBS 260.36]